MKIKNILRVGTGFCLLFTLLFGCGKQTGENEYKKAMLSWENGDVSRAQGQMEKAILKIYNTEKKSEAKNQLGLILWDLEKKEQAAKKFDESVELIKEISGADLNLAIALYYTGEMEKAQKTLKNILSAEPNNALARSFSGLILMQQNNWEKAMLELAMAAKEKPSDPAIKNALALAQLHLNNNTSSAIARLEQLTSTTPDYTPAFYNLAVIYDQWLHNSDRAIDEYKKYLQKADPQSLQTRDAKRAIERLSQPPAARSNSSSTFIARGSRLHGEKKYQEAITQYKKAIELNPSQKIAYYNMSLSLYALKQYDETAAACIQALKIDPSSSNAQYMLVLSYTKQKQWNEAEREAKILKKIDVKRGDKMLKYIATERAK